MQPASTAGRIRGIAQISPFMKHALGKGARPRQIFAPSLTGPFIQKLRNIVQSLCYHGPRKRWALAMCRSGVSNAFRNRFAPAQPPVRGAPYLSSLIAPPKPRNRQETA